MKPARRFLLLCVPLIVLLVGAGTAIAASPAAPTVTAKVIAAASGNLTVPWDVLPSANGKMIYASDRGLGLVAINPTKPSSAPVQIEDNGAIVTFATGLALSPNGKTLYVSGYVDGVPAVYIADVSGVSTDPDDYTIVGQVADPSNLVDNPDGLVISPNGRRLYIGNGAAGAASVSASIAVADLTAAGSWTIEDSYPEPALWDTTEFAWSPNHELLYVSNFVGDVGVLKVSGNDVTLDKLLPDTSGMYGIAVSPDGHTLYGTVLSDSLSFTGDSVSSLIDTFSLSKNGLTDKRLREQKLPTDTTMTGLSLLPTGKLGYAGWFTDTTAGNPSTSQGSVMKFTIPAAITKVTIDGKDKAGSKLTALANHPSGATVTFKWLAGGKAIKGADRSTLKITKKLTGKTLSVVVTAGAPGYSGATLTAKKK